MDGKYYDKTQNHYPKLSQLHDELLQAPQSSQGAERQT
jgi:hypothetical protein